MTSTNPPPNAPQRSSIVNAFAAWLVAEAQDILPELSLSFADHQLGIGFKRLPQLRCSLDHDALFVAALNGTTVWDIVFERNCLSVPLETGDGCFCGLCERRQLFANEGALWRDHLFAPFRAWVHAQVVPATRVAFERHGGVLVAVLEA